MTDNQQFIVSLATVLVPTLASFLSNISIRRSQKVHIEETKAVVEETKQAVAETKASVEAVHDLVNSKMTDLVAVNRSDAKQIGREEEREKQQENRIG